MLHLLTYKRFLLKLFKVFFKYYENMHSFHINGSQFVKKISFNNNI